MNNEEVEDLIDYVNSQSALFKQAMEDGMPEFQRLIKAGTVSDPEDDDVEEEEADEEEDEEDEEEEDCEDCPDDDEDEEFEDKEAE